MNFLEKDLETIIWENYEACQERGLDIDQQFFVHGKRYRQLNLAPYGIADLVNIHYSPSQDLYLVQVIELKKGKIDTAAYMQAKRYQQAVFQILDRIRKRGELSFKIGLSAVLIGNEVESSGDFVFMLNYDYDCTVFTYSYGFEGISFEKVSRTWAITNSHQSPVLIELERTLTYHHTDTYYGYQDYIQALGDPSLPLLVTPEGVLLNPRFMGCGD